MKNKLLLFVVILGVLVNCGPEKKVLTQPSQESYIFYPPLPNAPKFQYLTTFSSSKDVELPTNKLLKFVAGDEEEKKVRPIIKPYGAQMADGVLYVCDMQVGAITVLDLKNHQFRYMANKGPGRIHKPVNLTIDKTNGHIYVADIGKKQVLVFNLLGNFIRAYGEEGQFAPSDVAIHKNLLFVCDVTGHQIHVLDRSTGKELYKIGEAGSREGQLFHPTNIHISNDQLFVSDTNNFRVQIFDLKGKFLSSIGKIGDRPGSFSRNKGITVDREGTIYVIDSAFENVQIFNKDHQLLLYMLESGNDKSNINLPAGIALDYDNLEYFKKYISTQFEAKYLLFVMSQFGSNKINVYAHGEYRK